MKRLILMRHAKADMPDDGSSDKERPLNQRGKRDIPVMASVMIQKYPKSDASMCSDSIRTKETLEAVKTFGFSVGNIDFKSNLYLASVDTMESALAELDDSAESALICAHNPGIAEYIQKLTKEFEDVPPLGMALIVLNIDKWSDIYSAEGRLVRYDYPNKK
jgi:phosphohistidine phosphatase